jgi:hypothetical protein
MFHLVVGLSKCHLVEHMHMMIIWTYRKYILFGDLYRLCGQFLILTHHSSLLYFHRIVLVCNKVSSSTVHANDNL